MALQEELNFEEMESEHRQLLNVIRQHATEKPIKPHDQLMIRAQIPQYMKPLGENRATYGGIGGRGLEYDMDDSDSGLRASAVVGKIFLNYSGVSDIKDITISVHVPEPLSAEASPRTISGMKGAPAGKPR